MSAAAPVSPARFAAMAALVGDPARANMLLALMDGRALTASELARAAGIQPSTASGHLARLTEAGLLALARQGRHRYYRLGGAEAASLVEALLALAARSGDAVSPLRPVRTGPRDAALRQLRTCYDHLAGSLAVALADRMVARGHLVFSPDGGLLTADGMAFLATIQLTPPHDAAAGEPRMLCRPCLDWSERRPHIGGRLGAALCARCLEAGWVARLPGTRALRVTPPGRIALRGAFGIELEAPV